MVASHRSLGAGESPQRVATLIQATLNTVAPYQNRMARLLFEISCLNGLDKLMTGKCLPLAFQGYMQKVMGLFDESLRLVLGQLREAGFSVQCRPGCAHCCHQMPTGVASAELIYVYLGMQQSGAASKFFRRCLEAEELWVEVCHCQEREKTAPSLGPQQVEGLSKAFGCLEHPCPFLEANLCQIYPFRPLACRMHFSLSPPPWCRTSHFQNPHALSFNLEPAKCVFDALETLEDRFQLHLSDVMMCGLLELTVNVMRCEKIHWKD